MWTVYKYIGICLVLVLAQLNSFECQLEFPIFDTHSPHDVGDACTLSTGEKGVCTELRECSNLKRPLHRTRFLPIICSYTFQGPIICCDDVTTKAKERVSDIKCNEYKKLIEVDSRVTIDDDLNVLAVASGYATEPSEFPHMAAIGFKMPDDSVQWKCGGSLISEEFVMTAAHCIAFGDNQLDYIRISDRNLYASSDDSNVQERTVDKVFIHPKYRTTSNYHDIALIKLSEKITLGPTVRPACLWTRDQIDTTNVSATGWGLTKFGGSMSEELLKVDLEIFDQIECVHYYGTGRKFRNGIIEEQMCAGDRAGEKDTCEGDSGGPLQVRVEENDAFVYHIVGVTSFGKACGIANNPSIYTRVSKYIDWIESIVWPTG